MGLFSKHKQSDDDGVDLTQEEKFLDENFREELRNHGRWYFEKVINENGSLFKKDLDATIERINVELKDHVTQQLDTAIAQVNTELKDHVTKQLQDKFAEYTDLMKTTQDAALQSLTVGADELKADHQRLSEALKQNINEQDSLLHTAFEENKAKLISMHDAQEVALKTLTESAAALQDQYQRLSEMLKKDVETQKAALVTTFENNMAQIIEHYLLGAFGDQYDLKAQLPSIIKQMEENKQAIVDDMKL